MLLQGASVFQNKAPLHTLTQDASAWATVAISNKTLNLFTDMPQMVVHVGIFIMRSTHVGIHHHWH